MKYDDAVAWVDRFHEFGIHLGLDRIKKVLHALDDPHKKISCVHVGGTNGKGSVCRYISSILSSEGYKTGVYLSPHLIDFRERFQLNNDFISKEKIVYIVKRVKPIIERFASKGVQLTYFEVCTVIGFVFFAMEQVDYAIVEVGLGGRFDATNVITPLISVITNVSVDHHQQLGPSIERIAGEKAGIIKHGVPLVTGAKKPALSVIKQTCKSLHCSIAAITKKDIVVQKSSSTSQTVLVHGQFDDYLVSTSQLGTYQPVNIALSVLVIELLQQQGVFVTKTSIVNGIHDMRHPGRMQVLQHHPLVVVDGAHNQDAIKQVVSSVKDLFTYDKLILIFGVMNDKRIVEMLKEILLITDICIVAEPNQKRSAKSKDIAFLISQIDESKQVILSDSVADAYQKAIDVATDTDLILVTGSLFTVGEVMQLYFGS